MSISAKRRVGRPRGALGAPRAPRAKPLIAPIRMSKKTAARMLFAVFAASAITGSLVWGALTNWQYLNYKPASGIDVTPAFSVSISDGRSGLALKPGDFDIDLVAHEKGTTRTGTANWVHVWSGALDELTAAKFVDFNVDYDEYRGVINGSDDGLDEDTYDDGIVRPFYAREVAITPGVANALVAYITPAASNFALLNSNTGVVLPILVNGTITTRIATTVNFTLVSILSQVESDAAWVSYWSHTTCKMVEPNFVFTFSGASDENTLTNSVYTATGVLSTSVKYSTSMLTVPITYTNFIWSDAMILAGTNTVKRIVEYMGTDLI